MLKEITIKPKVYWGEADCQAVYKSGANKGKPCKNKAYWYSNSQYVCGFHGDKKDRIKLDKNPYADAHKAEVIKYRQKLVEEAKELNKKNEKVGNVICSQFKMMKPPEHIDGYLKIFPNFKHGGRKDGYGCPTLSPKSIGPIIHRMPNVPVAQNLENFHQFAKCFKSEVDPNDPNKPLQSFYDLRNKGYLDKIPHRHKFPLKDMKKLGQKGNKNIPLYSVYSDINGKEYHYSYIECRYFYCHFYERLTKKTAEFMQLLKWLKDGYNLQIIGYDAYPIDMDLYDHYLDSSKPFGHELVLYSLLVIEDPKKYPWNIYRKNNSHLYNLGWL